MAKQSDRDIQELEEFHSELSDDSAPSNGSRASVRERKQFKSHGKEGDQGKDALKHTQMWSVHGGRSYAPCEEAVETLPPSQYTIEHSDQLGFYFRKSEVNLDELIALPDSVSEEVVGEITKFWQYEARFRKFGFLWKRGALLWGPPGGGKTCTLQIISKNIVDIGGISVYVTDPNFVARGLQSLRSVEPKRPVVVMIEDIDAVINEYGETDVLALMDGELQIDNVVFIATTNYPSRLDKRFVNRPSRFDLIKKISMPSPQAREVYLKAKNARLVKPQNVDELKQWVELSKDFSIAHLKELIISVEVFEQPLEVAIERLRAMMKKPLKDDNGDESSPIGFTARD